MIELTKHYKIVFRDGCVVVYETSPESKVYPGEDTEYAEFDTLKEMEVFIKQNKIKFDTDDQSDKVHRLKVRGK